MKTSASFARIEPLEQRIAPALLVCGANLLGGDNPSIGESSIGQNNYVEVKVLTGQAIVWFDGTHITGISVGPNVTLDITGDVGPSNSVTAGAWGSIVANLDANGHLTDSDGDPSNGADGGLLLPNNILGVTTHPLSDQKGSIANIITGGSISNLSINGSLKGVYAGDGVFHSDSNITAPISVGPELSINPIDPTHPHTFSFSPATSSVASGALLSGASISNVNVQVAIGLQIFAGDGYASSKTGVAGGAGGSIQGVIIGSSLADPTYTGVTYSIKAGNGASSSIGGAGGSISRVVELSSSGIGSLIAGHGGNGTSGAGGAGGSITGVDLQSSSTIYHVTAGAGGQGAPGGAGGSLSNLNFVGNTHGTGIVVSAPFVNKLTYDNGTSIVPSENDVVLVDSTTGDMVVMKNEGNGSSFTPVLQSDNDTPITSDDIYTVSAQGSHPVSAVACDINGDGYADIVVGYGDGSVAVYYNTPSHPNTPGTGGVFMKKVYDPGSGDYIDNEPTGFKFAVPDSPIYQITTGAFGGGTSTDIAIISKSKNPGIETALTFATHAFGSDIYTVKPAINLGGTGTAIITETAPSGFDHVAIGFSDGRLATYGINGGSTFSTYLGGTIRNLDIDPQAHHFLALTSNGSLSLFSYETTTGIPTLLNGGPNLSLQAGTPLVAHFINDPSTSYDSIAVLSSIGAGSRIDDYTPDQTSGAFALTKSINSSTGLKNFVPSYEDVGIHGFAALPAGMGRFDYSYNDLDFSEFSVSMLTQSKEVYLSSGDGGTGLDLGGKLGFKGGAGGNITNFNADGVVIDIQAGNGGNSATGPGGAGGSLTNASSMTTLLGTTLTPGLHADSLVSVYAGNGGSPQVAAKTASGGNGGSITGYNIQVASGAAYINTGNSNHGFTGGNGGNSLGGAAGNGGNVVNLNSHLLGADLMLKSGDGGVASIGNVKGGAGGSITNLVHFLDQQNEPDGLFIIEKPFNVTITAGTGGDSAQGQAGAGGSINGANLIVDPSNETYNSIKKHDTDYIYDAHVDSTVRMMVLAGNGGNGAIGGAGGAITSLKTRSVFDQLDLDWNSVMLNPVVLSIASGNGGVGTTGAGGNAGAINLGASNPLLGITWFDPDANYGFTPGSPISSALTIESGHGGDGATKGGAGGAISSVFSANANFFDGRIIVGQELSSATVISGNGGIGGSSDGGAGGNINNLSIGARGLLVLSGDGGAGGTGTTSAKMSSKGGAGGSITNSLLGTVDYGINLTTGAGGSGVSAGGNGGLLSGMQLNVAAGFIDSPGHYVYVDSYLKTGDGGDATAAKAKAGNGGDIVNITHNKDVNSAITLIQAGSGGDNLAGIGGNGGSVKQLKEAGFIGHPGFGVSYLHDPQGLFVGKGGTGSTSGLAGAVLNVQARQIAAIAAISFDNLGAPVYGKASSISGVKADLIGYDQFGVGSAGTYDSGDGFLLAQVFSTISTFNNTRTSQFENPALV